MKRILCLLLMIGFALLVFSPKAKAEIAGSTYSVGQTLETTALGYGVRHTRETGFTTYPGNSRNDPQQVNAIEIPSTAGVKVIPWAQFEGNIWNFATVRRLIADYHAENPGWTVVAAVNGDFFDINREGSYGTMLRQVRGPQVTEGNFYKTRFANATSTTIGFTNNGSVNSIIGYQQISRTSTMKLAVFDENENITATYDVAKWNEAPADGEASVYFASYNATAQIVIAKHQVTGQGFVVGEADLALPTNTNDFYGKGTISSVVTGEEVTLNVGNFVIDSKNEAINSALSEGKKIRVQFEFEGAYAEATSLVGVASTVMYNGNFVEGSNLDRHPRTAIGRKADGTIVMTVIDGRQESKNMYGVSYPEIASIMQRFGCVDAYNLDGGGSSTIVVRENGEYVVKNSPSDGNERSDSNCLLVVVKDPEVKPEVLSLSQSSVSIAIDVTNANDHDIAESFVNISGKVYRSVDGIIDITGLAVNSKYNCRFGYYDKNNIEILTDVTFEIATSGRYSFSSIDYTLENDAYVFNVKYVDRDKTADFANGTLMISGKEYQLSEGKVTVPASELANGIYNYQLIIKITTLLNEEIATFEYQPSAFVDAICQMGENRKEIFAKN